MDTIKFNKVNTKIVAHRGLSGIECENTNAAFVAAGNRSYYGIETDVHVTADGKFVVHHDNQTGRLFNENINVEESTYEELRRLYVTNHHSINGDYSRTDLVIPTLDDYVSICKRYNKVSVLELKNAIVKDKLAEILSVIDSHGYLDNTIIISFSWDNLAIIKELRSKQNVQFLTRECDRNLIAKLKENDFDLDIDHKFLNESNVNEIRSAKIKLNCWTCDTPDRGEELANFGLDYITSNILE